MDKVRIAVFDLDGTLIKGQSQQLLLSILHQERLITNGSFLKLMGFFLLYKLRIIHGIDKITHYAYSVFAGLLVSDIDKIVLKHRQTLLNRIFSESYKLVESEKRISSEVYLVSAAADPIVRLYASVFCIDDYLCTQIEVQNGTLTGKIIGNHIYGHEKVRVVKNMVSNRNREDLHLVCYADHSSDVELLIFADEAVMVNPDNRLKRIAKANNWKMLYFSDESNTNRREQ